MSGTLHAFGAVTLRGSPGHEEVLLVHRQAYDDWTIPKGKPIPDELPPVTAVREVREETGVLIHLGTPLQQIHYRVDRDRAKKVNYWRAAPFSEYYRVPDKEVDEVRWATIDEARDLLTYADEIDVLGEALTRPPTTPLLLVRHGKAMLRKHWTGPDQARRLSGRGRRQAAALVPLLEAFGVTRLISSSSVRCVETLAPYGRHARVPTTTVNLLTEEEGTYAPDDVARFLRDSTAGLQQPTAICGHRPVLPAMQQGLGLKVRPMVVSETTVIHRSASDENLFVEHIKPTE